MHIMASLKKKACRLKDSDWTRIMIDSSWFFRFSLISIKLLLFRVGNNRKFHSSGHSTFLLFFAMLVICKICWVACMTGFNYSLIPLSRSYAIHNDNLCNGSSFGLWIFQSAIINNTKNRVICNGLRYAYKMDGTCFNM